jgi:hypothetical protein
MFDLFVNFTDGANTACQPDIAGCKVAHRKGNGERDCLVTPTFERSLEISPWYRYVNGRGSQCFIGNGET